MGVSADEIFAQQGNVEIVETFSQFLLDSDYRNSFLSYGLIFLEVNAFFLEARNLRGISFGRRTLHSFFFFLQLCEKSGFEMIFKISPGFRFDRRYCYEWCSFVS